MISLLGATYLDSMFGQIMEWLPAHLTLELIVIILILACLLGVLAAMRSNLKDELARKEALITLLRKKSETLNKLIVHYEQKENK